MGKPRAPAPPDYAAAAKQQGEANLNSAIATNVMGRVNQITPDGSLTYQDIGFYTLPDGTRVPLTQMTTTLSPGQQKLYDQNLAISQQLNDLAEQGIGYVGSMVNTPFDTQGLAQRPTSLPGSGDYGAQRDAVTNALIARMNPELDRQEESLRTRLANQGLEIGGEAANRELFNFGQTRNDALISALLAGGTEQSRMQSMDLNAANYANRARDAGLQEQAFLRSEPLNTLNALRTGNQVSMPNFTSTSSASVQAAPIYDAVADRYQAELQNFQTRMQGYNALMGGLAGLAGSAASAFIPQKVMLRG
jgi:hypothetical protein